MDLCDNCDEGTNSPNPLITLFCWISNFSFLGILVLSAFSTVDEKGNFLKYTRPPTRAHSVHELTNYNLYPEKKKASKEKDERRK